MKKLLVLSFCLTMLSPISFAETIYLYKQTNENTLPTGETVTTTNQTTVITEQKGGTVYKVRSNKNNANINNTNENVTYSTTNDNKNGNLNEGEVIIGKEKLNSNPYADNSSKKSRKNKIKNTYGNNQDYITAPSTKDNTENLNTLSRLIAKINDPYVIKINGTKYYMVKNSADGNYTLNNILGYGDSKTSLFSSLIALNSNNDKKITKDELNKANIRFIAVDNNGKLQLNNKENDFTDILYIDLSNIRESVNTANMIGSFGYFDVYIKDKHGVTKKIIGYISFDSDEELLEMIK